MTVKQLAAVADLHGVQYRIEYPDAVRPGEITPNGRIYLQEVYTIKNSDGSAVPGEKWVNVTRWTARRLFAWLGY